MEEMTYKGEDSTSYRANCPARRLSIHEAQFPRMVPAEKKMQVGILAGIPRFPSMFPVGPSEITAIFSEDFYGLHFARSSLRVENKLRAAIRIDRSIHRRQVRRLF
jgi:hypothetical protein